MSFDEKWKYNPELCFNETLDEKSFIFKWILERNGFTSVDEFKQFLSTKERILDAGCGNGRISALFHKYAPDTKIVGIDSSIMAISAASLMSYAKLEFFQRDLLEDLTDLGKFNYIYCQEVLHHVADPRKAFHNLCQLLNPNGEIAIYVYKRKAVIREFVDEYIRGKFQDMSFEEKIEVCDQITEFGKRLKHTDGHIDAPDIPILGIKKGCYSVKSFVYNFIMKCFWNDELSLKDNSTINFDWYNPEIANKYSPYEIRKWYKEEGLEVIREYIDPYGITIRGVLINVE